MKDFLFAFNKIGLFILFKRVIEISKKMDGNEKMYRLFLLAYVVTPLKKHFKGFIY